MFGWFVVSKYNYLINARVYRAILTAFAATARIEPNFLPHPFEMHLCDLSEVAEIVINAVAMFGVLYCVVFEMLFSSANNGKHKSAEALKQANQINDAK